MTLQEKQAQDELVSHLREENNKLREMYALATERAEKAEAELTRMEHQYEAVIADMLARWQRSEAVVNVARECVQWNRLDCGRGLYSMLVDAVDAYDARVEEAE